MRRPNSVELARTCSFEFPVILDFSKPSVSLHKNGKYLLFKANDVFAAEVLREINTRMDAKAMRRVHFYNAEKYGSIKAGRVELWRHLNGDIAKHPFCDILRSYGVEVGTSDTLKNYILKEYRQRVLEQTPYPAIPIENDGVPLFGRCNTGSPLLCIKNYGHGVGAEPLFKQGSRYLVTNVGANDEGLNRLTICTEAIKHGARLDLAGKGKLHDWTELDPPMEEWFDDSESVDFGKTIDELYPERVARMTERLNKLSYVQKAVEAGKKNPLFEHVRIDAAMEALKRGVINCKLMRMGKAQPLDAKLLTPAGWDSMGNARVGGQVIGRDGLPHSITAVYPQGEKDVYRVTFSDGSTTECCDEHLWEIYTAEGKYSGRPNRVLELGEIKDRLTFANGNTRYYVPLTSPVFFPAQSLPLDPYAIGLLLGDGTLGLDASGYGTPQFSTEDPELLTAIEAALPAGMAAAFNAGCSYRLTTPQEEGWRPSPLAAILNSLDMRHKAENKYIPEMYKFSSIEQRRALLAGLLDTDGDVSNSNGPTAGSVVSFSTVSERLCDDVRFLVESLGGVATKADRQTHYIHNDEYRDGQPSFRLRISLPSTERPFRLRRKADLYRATVKFTPSRGIVAVDLVSRKQCQCIVVDTEDHLYLTDHCIVTHNTSEAITICELWGSKKIGIIGSRNVRIAWRKEFKRLGMENFVFVNRFEDLDKEGKYYLFTLDWLKGHSDPTEDLRKDKENYLRPSERTVRRSVGWDKQAQNITVYQHNSCPHCSAPLERPLGVSRGVLVKTVWTTDKGYLCRNPKCSWFTDNRIQDWKGKSRCIHNSMSHRGAAWAEPRNRLQHHHPGSYVDVMLAQHARCSGTKIKGRMCLECGATDGAWVPSRYKRVRNNYSAAVGDEIHNAKDGTNQQSRAMYSFRARRRIAMTGTLLSNSPLDAYWPLHWAIGQQCEQFPWQGVDGKGEFEKRFCDFAYLEKPTGEIDEETGVEITETVRKRTPFLINPPDWWRAMQPKIVRRNYTDPLYLQSLLEAGMSLPSMEDPHGIHRTKVPMTQEQVRLMLSALQDFKVEYAKMLEEAEKKGNAVNSALVIAKMAALRTIATVPERLNAKIPGVYTGPNGGGKMRQIVNIVAEAVSQGKKVFILSDFSEMQKHVTEALAQFNPVRILSSWSDERRIAAMEAFADDPDCGALVAGTRMVREAIDASCADVTICCDLLWSPAWQCQAWSRTLAPTLRERACDIYLMLSQNSLDEYIYTVFYAKMIGAEQALDRKVRNRRSMDFDVKFFAQRVIEEEAALSLQIRDTFDDMDDVDVEMEMPEERLA